MVAGGLADRQPHDDHDAQSGAEDRADDLRDQQRPCDGVDLRKRQRRGAGEGDKRDHDPLVRLKDPGAAEEGPTEEPDLDHRARADGDVGAHQ